MKLVYINATTGQRLEGFNESVSEQGGIPQKGQFIVFIARNKESVSTYQVINVVHVYRCKTSGQIVRTVCISVVPSNNSFEDALEVAEEESYRLL